MCPSVRVNSKKSSVVDGNNIITEIITDDKYDNNDDNRFKNENIENDNESNNITEITKNDEIDQIANVDDSTYGANVQEDLSSHEMFLSDLCINVERELGLVLNKKYALAKARRKAIIVIIYYVERGRDSSALLHWKNQVRKCIKGQQNTAIIKLSRTIRGWLARTDVKKIRKNKLLQIKAEMLRQRRLIAAERYKVNKQKYIGNFQFSILFLFSF